MRLVSSSVNAKNLSIFISEEEPDITIAMKYNSGTARRKGNLNYKNKTFIDASEEFFVESGAFRKFFAHG